MDEADDNHLADSEKDAGEGGLSSKTAGGRRPSFQFYPADWLKDARLQSLSPQARDIWLALMCHMHLSGRPYGHLSFEPGVPIPPKHLARTCRVSLKRLGTVVDELLRVGIGARNASGVVYSPRMVWDEAKRNARAKGGFNSQANPNVPRPRRH